jgi:hypothetical protein
MSAYINDVESLVDGGLLVEREAGINFGGDLSWDNGENLLSELDEESVKSSIDLGIDIRSVLLSVTVRFRLSSVYCFPKLVLPARASRELTR